MSDGTRGGERCRCLKTSAKRLPDGTFSITGTKCFISCGDHDLAENIIHPVLARIEGDPPGTGGISIFIVPKIRVNADGSLGEPNDVHTGNIEHKMGIKGSATCTLNFGDEGKCIGELLGKEREGMRIMFLMMNGARFDVGMQGLGVASAALEHAIAYAKERIQSVPVWEMKNPDAKAVPIIQHPDVRRDLLWMKAHVEGIRALNYFTAYCMDMAKAVPGGMREVAGARGPADVGLQGLFLRQGDGDLLQGNRCLRRLWVLPGISDGTIPAGLQDHPHL